MLDFRQKYLSLKVCDEFLSIYGQGKGRMPTIDDFQMNEGVCKYILRCNLSARAQAH